MKVRVLDKPFFDHRNCQLHPVGAVLEYHGKVSSNLEVVEDDDKKPQAKQGDKARG